MENVTFRYKDYADGSCEKTMTVNGTDFIGMFLQHVLPSGFHRVRFSGYLTNCKKTKNLKLIHRLRNTVYRGNPYRKMKTAERLLLFYGKDICSCPECHGKLIMFPRGKPSPSLPSLISALNSAVCWTACFLRPPETGRSYRCVKNFKAIYGFQFSRSHFLHF